MHICSSGWKTFGRGAPRKRILDQLNFAKSRFLVEKCLIFTYPCLRVREPALFTWKSFWADFGNSSCYRGGGDKSVRRCFFVGKNWKSRFLKRTVYKAKWKCVMSGGNKNMIKKSGKLQKFRGSYLLSRECDYDQKFFCNTLECTWSIFKVSSKFFPKSWKNGHFHCPIGQSSVRFFNFLEKISMKI